MKIAFFANTDWYLYNFRLPLALAVRDKQVEVVFLSPPGPYARALQEPGCRWLPIPMERRSLNPWKEIRLVQQLTRLYRTERPDLVHHFTIKCVVYGSLAARMAGIKPQVNAVTGMGHVFSDHSLRWRLLRPPIKQLLRIALSGADNRLILQNPDDYEAFMRAGLAPAEHMRLILSSGVDTERFKPAPPRPAGDTLRVLMATRLLWNKGVGEYIEAARHFKQRNAPISFLLAGSPDPGNPDAVPAQRIKAWHEQGLITALGHVDAMERLLPTVDLVVFPSYYGEGVPRNLTEAAACALPIVTTQHPGCREVVEHGVNGLLTPRKDSMALINAIQELFKQPQRRAAFGQAGREKVLREFDQRSVLEKTFAVYRELIPLPC